MSHCPGSSLAPVTRGLSLLSLLTVCGATLAPTPAHAQGVIDPRWQLRGADFYPTADNTQFGRSVDIRGDLDGDGVDDLVVGSPYYPNINNRFGQVTAISGATGLRLWSHVGTTTSDFGSSVAILGDVDGDGRADVVVGAPYARDAGGSVRGMVRVLSGRDGTTIRQHNGDSFSAWTLFGSSVAALGDVTGDGVRDYVVGAPTHMSNGAFAVVFSGADGSIHFVRGTPNSSGLGWDSMGYAVGDAGDITGDGVDDVLVSDTNARDPSNVNLIIGAAYVYSGTNGSLVRTFSGSGYTGFGMSLDGVGDQDGDGVPDVAIGGVVPGSPTSARFWLRSGAVPSVQLTSGPGNLVRGAGDLDGDGVEEILIADSVATFNSRVGQSWVRHGGTFATRHTFRAPSGGSFWGLGGRGDVNGDGFIDFVIGTTGIGEADVYLGGPATEERLRIEGDLAGDQLGTSVHGAGDLNADGFDDLVVGAPLNDYAGVDAGMARAISGFDGSTLHTWYGSAAGDRFGYAVAGAGDVDGDGFDDVIVGAYLADPNGMTDAGETRVLSGRTGLPLFTVTGSSQGENLGVAVAGLGDVDGDGHDDVAISAQMADSPTLTDVGKVEIHSGRDGSLLRELFGDTANDLFGRSIGATGDVDGDGIPDLIVGAYHGDDPNLNVTDTGWARVYSGAGWQTLCTVYGPQQGSHFGYVVAGAGDVDHDGRNDLIVGAFNTVNYGLAEPRGRVRVFDSTGTTIWDLRPAQNSTSSWWGTSVGSAGDVNGDGFGDFLIGTRGHARLHSGRDGSVLIRQFDSPSANPGFGVAACSAGDLDGDGLDEVIVGDDTEDPGTPARTNAGTAFVYRLDYLRPGVVRPGIARRHGTACPGANGRLPHIDVLRAPRVGDPIACSLRGGPVGAPSSAVLLVGTPITLSLNPIGLLGCTLHVASWGSIAATTDTTGRAHTTVPLLNDPALIGLGFDAQWIVVDPGAPHALPVALSDAMHMTIGA